MPRPPRVPIGHSTPGQPEGAVVRGKPAERDRRTVTIVLKTGEPGEDLAQGVGDLEAALPLSRAARLRDREAATPRGATDEQFRRVERFAAEHGLEVVGKSQAQHHLQVRGTVAQLNAAFGVELELSQHSGRVFQTHSGPVSLPADVVQHVQAVIGLADIHRGRPLGATAVAGPEATSYTLPELVKRYRFPGGNGKGQRIAIISFGGGYHEEDLDWYFRQIVGLRTPPKVSAVSVSAPDGAGPGNNPFPMKRLRSFIEAMSDPNLALEQMKRDLDCETCWARALATLECTMDIEIIGAIAPEADIDVYFADDTDDGWRAAIQAAAGIRDDDERRPVRAHRKRVEPASVISLSWGFAEAEGGASWLELIESVLKEAFERRVTVCCASGDFGSLGVDPGDARGYDRVANLDFPASSPFVLACGGTSIGPDGEVAWNNEWKGVTMATGGGVSGFFKRPGWQAGSNVPPHNSLEKVWLDPGENRHTWAGRGVPDVAANADSASGYELYIGGRPALGGGTSAAAPLWAGLVALLNQNLSGMARRPIRLGLPNKLLYRKDVAVALRSIDAGDNRLPGTRAGVASFDAGPGWDPCTGLGVPDGESLLEALSRPE